MPFRLLIADRAGSRPMSRACVVSSLEIYTGTQHCLYCEGCVATTVIDTTPSLPFTQTGWLRGLHPLNTLFVDLQNILLTVQSVAPTARRSFKFRDDPSIGRIHNATLEIMKLYVHTARIFWNGERVCLLLRRGYAGARHYM